MAESEYERQRSILARATFYAVFAGDSGADSYAGFSPVGIYQEPREAYDEAQEQCVKRDFVEIVAFAPNGDYEEVWTNDNSGRWNVAFEESLFIAA